MVIAPKHFDHIIRTDLASIYQELYFFLKDYPLLARSYFLPFPQLLKFYLRGKSKSLLIGLQRIKNQNFIRIPKRVIK